MEVATSSDKKGPVGKEEVVERSRHPASSSRWLLAMDFQGRLDSPTLSSLLTGSSSSLPEAISLSPGG